MPVDRQHPVEAVLDDAVGATHPAQNAVHLQVHLDVVPISLVPGTGLRLKHSRAHPVELLVVVRPAAIAFREQHRLHHPIAAAHRTLLRHPDQVQRHRPQAPVDRQVILERHPRRPRSAHEVGLDVSREPIVGQRGVLPVLIAEHVELVRMVACRRADPVVAVLDPVAHIQRRRRREPAPRRASPGRIERPRSEVDLERARRPRHVLRPGDRHAWTVVPPPRCKRGILEGLLEEHPRWGRWRRWWRRRWLNRRRGLLGQTSPQHGDQRPRGESAQTRRTMRDIVLERHG